MGMFMVVIILEQTHNRSRSRAPQTVQTGRATLQPKNPRLYLYETKFPINAEALPMSIKPLYVAVLAIFHFCCAQVYEVTPDLPHEFGNIPLNGGYTHAATEKEMECKTTATSDPIGSFN